MPLRLKTVLPFIVAAVLAGCASTPEAPRAGQTGKAGATAADRRLPDVPERDRVLHDYRAAVSALRAGRVSTVGKLTGSVCGKSRL